jgi:hypothetical protein
MPNPTPELCGPLADFRGDSELAATVSEPATLALLALGLTGIGFKRKPTA